jgi:hypothetical protein
MRHGVHTAGWLLSALTVLAATLLGQLSLRHRRSLVRIDPRPNAGNPIGV